jgi:predicted MFS family arabinose efflux permease
MSLSRKIILCFNLRWVLIFNLLIFMTGAAIAGAAPNFASVIIGRVIMGIGGCHVQTTYVLLSFLRFSVVPFEASPAN